jgi:hypothetical protein
MTLQLTLVEKIERAFSARRKPAQVRIVEDVLQHDPEMEFLRDDPDVKDALWFSGRDRQELTWHDWQEHSSAISFFDREAFCLLSPEPIASLCSESE